MKEFFMFDGKCIFLLEYHNIYVAANVKGFFEWCDKKYIGVPLELELCAEDDCESFIIKDVQHATDVSGSIRLILIEIDELTLRFKEVMSFDCDVIDKGHNWVKLQKVDLPPYPTKRPAN